jgi:hypothetical protein
VVVGGNVPAVEHSGSLSASAAPVECVLKYAAPSLVHRKHPFGLL